ncbi:MAG: hypothetical protein GY788_27695 [bacterium]|nr:hypothetical protein [bacterium]
MVGLPKSRTPEFDSRRLDKSDVFAATFLRPGAYSVHNAHGKARTELAVRYVTRGKERYRPSDPVRASTTRGSYVEEQHSPTGTSTSTDCPRTST